MLHWHSPREDLIGVIALIVYVITCGSLNGGRNGSILDSHTIYFLSFGAFNLQESPPRIRGKSILWGLRRESPPRMRGKAHQVAKRGDDQGITPAHAGRRGQSTSSKVLRGDHPRACGEKIYAAVKANLRGGSPPRMRGEAHSGGFCEFPHRITPAHAGKSPPGAVCGRKRQDHPRACGEKRL